MDSKTLTDLLAEEMNLTAGEIALLTESLCGAMLEASRSGDAVAVNGFGLFETRKRSERITVNPSTGTRMLVPPRLAMAFRPSPALRQKINATRP